MTTDKNETNTENEVINCQSFYRNILLELSLDTTWSQIKASEATK